MKFAENYLQKCSEFWKTVLFADESKYEYLHQMDILVCVENPVKNFGGGESSSISPPWWWQFDGVRNHGSISRGNIHFVEGSMNKHVCVNILRELLKN